MRVENVLTFAARKNRKIQKRVLYNIEKKKKVRNVTSSKEFRIKQTYNGEFDPGSG